MKTLGLKLVWMFVVGGIAVMAQGPDSPDSNRDRKQDVPGDDFSLEGALELFKGSASPEAFERKLNSPESRVNNLDLNGDGQIDYIRVIDRSEGNVHAFIMQAVLSSTESQDVAVIELEKLGNGKAVLQITGDADVYGIETIIEPTEEVRVNAGTSTARAIVNVWAWPSVQYVYSPYYEVWVSPWHWRYRPYWWYSWRPVTYYEYYSYWYPYRRHYSYCHTHRVEYAWNLYRPYRTYSPVYYRRHESRIAHYRSNQRDDRARYGSDHDRNRRTDYADDRKNRDRNEGKHDLNTRTGFDSRERSMVNTPALRERRQGVERKLEMKRNEPTHTIRSEARNKLMVERSSPHSERSTKLHMDRRSLQPELKSFDRPDRNRAVGGEVNKSNGNGRGDVNGRKRH